VKDAVGRRRFLGMKNESYIAPGGWIWILVPAIVGVGGYYAAGVFGADSALRSWILWGGLGIAGFMLFFHRNPRRVPPPASDAVVAGADGWVRRIDYPRAAELGGREVVRISIFLSPFDVHVNRAPLAGRVSRLEYVPGKHFFTIQNAASEFNEHSRIWIATDGFEYLVKQIVGPFVRRVVYWLKQGEGVDKGEMIGMMRFGSRLDILLPRDAVEVSVKVGDRVRAGVSVVARLRPGMKES